MLENKGKESCTRVVPISKAMKFSKNDSIRNCFTNWRRVAPEIFLIPISLALLMDLAVVIFT